MPSRYLSLRVMLALRERRIYKEALKKIQKEEGLTCMNHKTSCHDIGCHSSFRSWEIAEKAIKDAQRG